MADMERSFKMFLGSMLWYSLGLAIIVLISFTEYYEVMVREEMMNRYIAIFTSGYTIVVLLIWLLPDILKSLFRKKEKESNFNIFPPMVVTRKGDFYVKE